MGIGFFKTPFTGGPSDFDDEGCFGKGGGSMCCRLASKGTGAGRDRQKARGINV